MRRWLWWGWGIGDRVGGWVVVGGGWGGGGRSYILSSLRWMHLDAVHGKLIEYPCRPSEQEPLSSPLSRNRKHFVSSFMTSSPPLPTTFPRITPQLPHLLATRAAALRSGRECCLSTSAWRYRRTGSHLDPRSWLAGRQNLRFCVLSPISFYRNNGL